MEHVKKNDIPFEEDPPRVSESESVYDSDRFLVDIDGYEGPIDVLLVMARDQKVDLTKISILQLARQYLAFIDRAKELKLDLAAEYLVMASWLAYLKSRLLLPKDENDDEIDAETMAEALQFQLLRLEAMQKTADELFSLKQLGVDVFPRGMPAGLKTVIATNWEAGLYDLLKAYGDIERRKMHSTYDLPEFTLMSMEVAYDRLSRMLGQLPRKGRHSVWTTLDSFLPEGIKTRLYGRSSMASLFTAGLELVKQGRVEMKQDGIFRPIYLRANPEFEQESGETET